MKWSPIFFYKLCRSNTIKKHLFKIIYFEKYVETFFKYDLNSELAATWKTQNVPLKSEELLWFWITLTHLYLYNLWYTRSSVIITKVWPTRDLSVGYEHIVPMFTLVFWVLMFSPLDVVICVYQVNQYERLSGLLLNRHWPVNLIDVSA